MKDLDSHTVLEIIKMIEVKISYMEDSGICDQYDYGAIHILHDLRDHLQDYIEGLVSQVENQTGE